MQDKEELTLKRIKAEGGAGDKDGLLEAEVRKKFNGIVNKYGILGLTASEEPKIGSYDQPRAYFKVRSNSIIGATYDVTSFFVQDKKLNRLWEKAEKAGLSEEELITLKQEFKHHQVRKLDNVPFRGLPLFFTTQEKVEQFHNLLEMADAASKDQNDQNNHIHLNDEDEEASLGINDLFNYFFYSFTP